MKKSTVKRQIMWGDLDSLGVVFYPRYYELIDASGHLFFQSLNLDLVSLWKERGIIFGLLETGCQYHLPGRYSEWIEIVTYIDDISDKTVVLKHDISRISDKARMAEGFEKRICLNVTGRLLFKAVDIPKDIWGILSNAKSCH
jgi:YbgC/YbaW family acyl-CoA thioester hydrolase